MVFRANLLLGQNTVREPRKILDKALVLPKLQNIGVWQVVRKTPHPHPVARSLSIRKYCPKNIFWDVLERLIKLIEEEKKKLPPTPPWKCHLRCNNPSM